MAPARAGAPTPFTPVPDSAFTAVVIPPSPHPTPIQLVLEPVVERPVVTQPPVPTAQPKVITTPYKAPLRSGRFVVGVATYYCWPAGGSRCTHGYPASGAYGAAGPALRAALGNWRGKTVYVNGVAVRLIDWCGCGGDHVIDVYHSTWVKIPNQSHVVIRW